LRSKEYRPKCIWSYELTLMQNAMLCRLERLRRRSVVKIDDDMTLVRYQSEEVRCRWLGECYYESNDSRH
jgi:hypothetical protein